MSIVVIDFGAGNIDSVLKAVQYCGGEVKRTTSATDLETCSHMILPGVGSFDDAYNNLEATGLIPVIKEQIEKYQIPFLGICVGMQLLASYGEEGEGSKGLGLIPGEVTKINGSEKYKIPHVGWNDISITKETSLTEGLTSGSDFYFVHSYSFKAENPDDVIATTEYSESIVAAVNRGSVYGTQFHPEKSQKLGAQILKNFINL